MRAFLSLLAFAAVAFSFSNGFTNVGLAANDSCTAMYHCVKKDAQCVGDLVSQTCSSAGDCCEFPLRCFSGKCAPSNMGWKCFDDSECKTSYYGTHVAACLKDACLELLNANDYCDNSSQCIGGMTCASGRCSGYPLGHNCTPSWTSDGVTVGFTCAWGLVCNRETSVCEAARTKGASCVGVEYACEAGMICNGGVCIDQWAIATGGACTLGVDGVCATSLYCSNDSKCTSATDLVFSECVTDHDCGKGTAGKCICSQVSGKKYCEPAGTDSNCAGEIRSAQSCWKSNKCAFLATKNDKSCAQTKCLTSTNKIFACTGTCGGLRLTVGSCLASMITDNCPTFPTYAKILVAFGVLIALIAIVAIVYVVYSQYQKKKKTGYQPIGQQQQQ